VLKPIGAGGMGVVYAARDHQLRRTVALKMLQPGGAGETDEARMRERLLREARAMARLSHPNVLAVYDVGELDGQVFLAGECMDLDTCAIGFASYYCSGPLNSLIEQSYCGPVLDHTTCIY